MPPGGRWKLTMNGGMTIQEIEVDSREHGDSDKQPGVTNGIAVTTKPTNGTAEGGIRIEQLTDTDERVEEMQHSFEESGSHSGSGSQLVCSGQFSMERKQ